jgi:Na+-driven multidrug efflux pump
VSHNQPDQPRNPILQAHETGWRSGLAVGAIAVSVVSFISLLGIEKALLAITLAILAFRGSRRGEGARRLAGQAIVISCVYVVTIIMLLIVFRSQLAKFLQMMHQLS